MATTIATMKDETKTDNLLPRTQIKAIFDKNGDYLDDDLTAADLNPLKDGALDNVLVCDEGVPGTPIPTDADTLEGHPASYFATVSEVSSLIKTTTKSCSFQASGDGSYAEIPDLTIDNKVLSLYMLNGFPLVPSYSPSLVKWTVWSPMHQYIGDHDVTIIYS